MGRKRDEVHIDGGDELGAARPFARLLAGSGALTQTEVSRRLRVTTAATNLHFSRLAEDGLIEAVDGESRSGMGRPAKRWQIAADRNFTLCFVLLPPLLHVALADFGDRIAVQEEFDLSDYPGMRDKNELVGEAFSRMRRRAEAAGGKIRNVFYGAPGDLDWAGGALARVVAMPELVGFNLRRVLQDRFGVVSRDYTFKHAEMLGELLQSGPEDIIAILSWELGLGIVCGSRLGLLNNMLPEESQLRDIGHGRLVRDGRLCRCGKHGCLEAYTGGWTMIEAVAPRAATLAEFMNLVETGDADAVAVLGGAAETLGKFMARLVALFSVNRIVVSGPMERVFALARERFEAGLASLLGPEELARIALVVRSPLEGALAGGCFAARRLFFDPNFIGAAGTYHFEPFLTS